MRVYILARVEGGHLLSFSGGAPVYPPMPASTAQPVVFFDSRTCVVGWVRGCFVHPVGQLIPLGGG